jgi:hypothetical protein
MLKRAYYLETNMQLTPDILSYIIVAIGLIFQTIWFVIGRKSRDSYMKDITHFRRPSNYFSELYAWRLKDLHNPLIEGVLFEVFLIIMVVGIGVYSADFESLLAVSSIIVLVGVLSFLSAIQMARRVKTVIDLETGIVQRLKYTDDKIGSARELVKNLYDQGPFSDGRKWFALFKLAQREDVTGYAVRDILIEKGKTMVEKSFYGTSFLEDTNEKEGPGIS